MPNPKIGVAQHHSSPIPGYAFVHSKSPVERNTISVDIQPRLSLPHPKDTKKWKHIDNRIVEALSLSLSLAKRQRVAIDRVIEIFENQVYSVLNTECKSKPQPKTVTRKPKQYPSRLLQKLRRSKKDARRTYRRLLQNGEDSSSARKAMFQAVRAYHKINRITKKNVDVKRATFERKRFLHDPHRYAKELFHPPQQGKPNFSKEVAESYFRETYSDPNRDFKYDPPPGLPRPEKPKIPFDVNFPDLAYFTKICWRKRNASAPGINGISYQVYKFCPQTRSVLYSLLRRVWMERMSHARGRLLVFDFWQSQGTQVILVACVLYQS